MTSAPSPLATPAGGASTTESPDAAPKAARSADLAKAAREFEQIFVRAMLAETPLGAKHDVYGDLAVDAVARSVTAGRGLGLAELIQRAVGDSTDASRISLKETK